MRKFIEEHNLSRRMLAFLLAAVMILGYVPVATKAETEVVPGEIKTVADPQTLTRPEEIYGSNTLNAGKVTVGKSVNNGAVSIPYAAGKSQTFTPAQNNFIVTMSQTAQVTGLTSEMSVPVDVVFVLDTSSSMDSNNKVETMVEAANEAIATLLAANPQNRVGVVAFSGVEGGGTSNNAAASVLTHLGHYDGDGETNHIQWVYSNGTETAPTDRWGRPTEYSKGYIKGRGSDAGYRKGTSTGTNIHAGVALGGQMLANATETTVNGMVRMPFLVVMSDGQPSYAGSGETWYNPNLYIQLGNLRQAAGIGFLPALTAAYYKGLITEHYYGNTASANNRCYVYTMGLGLAALDDNSENLAYMTMDPANTGSTNTYFDDFEGYYEKYLDGKNFTVTTRDDGRDNYTITEASIATTEKYVKGIGYSGSYKYNDDYFEATDADDLGAAFTSVVNKIQEKAISSPTHVTTGGDHNFEGYVTFTDPIGEYMEVKNVRGILANGHLHPGADFAQLLVNGNNSEFNNSLKNVLKKRMSMTGSTATDAFINEFIAAAKSSKNQANYVSANNYDNSIVWWGSEYDSGEEDKGVQVLAHADNDTIEYIESCRANNTIPADADYVCRSYFFYCSQDTSHEFMYLIVRVQRQLTAPYQETVVISCPASLLSVDEVLINEKTANGQTTYTADVEDHYPLRVVYEVGLRSDINAQNVDSIVTDGYRAEKPNGSGSVNYDATTGTYYFFTNDWNRNESAGSHHRAMAKATFDAAADNGFYTYQKDTLLLDKNGNPYTGNLSSGLELYYEREYFKWTGNGSGSFTATKDTELIKVLIPDDYNTVIKQVDGKWYITKGVYTASTLQVTGDDIKKDPDNYTGTSEIVSHAHRTGSSNNSHYTVLLGNNGKLSLVREPAKSVSINDSTANDDGKTVMVGDILTYTIKVSNADDTAVTAVVTDTVPKGTEFKANLGVDGDVSGAAFTNEGGKLTWSDISVPAKGSVTVSFQVTVTTEALSGANDVVNIDNQATIKLGNNPAYTTNKVTNPPEGKKVVDLEGKDINGETVKVGDVLTYRIRVQSDAVDSNGTPVKSDIVVTDQIPAGTTFKSASHGGVHDNGTVTWCFTGENQLAAGASVVLTMEVYVDASAKVVENSSVIEFPNQASIKVGSNDPRITNKVNNVAGVGNISISKAFAAGTTGFADKGFNLVLTETGYKLNGDYVLSRTGAEDSKITFTNGVAQATIKNGEVITVKGIPLGATIQVAETLSATEDAGWSISSYTPTVATVTVTDSTGTAAGDVKVENKYTAAPVEFALSGTKFVDDKNFPDGVFAFNLKRVNFDEATKTLTEDVTNPSTHSANVTISGDKTNAVANGVVFTFTPRVFAEETTNYYLINEAPTTIKGVTIDSTQYLLKLVVKDVNARLTVTSYIQSSTNGTWGEFSQFAWENSADEVVFHNTYAPSTTSVTLSGTKELEGRKMRDGEFSFQLVKIETGDNNETVGTVVATANNISGAFSFAPIHFTEEDTGKTYRYAIREAAGTDGNVSYDKTYYLVELSVEDDHGELKTIKKITKYTATNGAYDNGTVVDSIVYSNTYHTQDVSVSFSGTKTLSGKAANGLNADDFTFELLETDDSWNPKNPQVIASVGANEDGPDGNRNEAAIKFADITYGVDLFDTVAADANGIKTLNFYYVAREVVPAESEPSFDVNMKYAENKYQIEVKLTLDTNTGLMKAEIIKVNGANVNSDSYSNLDFENIKNPDKVYFAPEGKKTTKSEKDIPSGLRFSFRVTNLDGTKVEGTGLSKDAVKDKAVDIEFTNMEFNHEAEGRTYLYRIEETMKTPVTGTPDIVYDATQYVLAVTISRDTNKELVAIGKYYRIPNNVELSDVTVDNYLDVLEEVSSISFTNTFNVAKSLNITATKKQTGDRGLNERDYDFRFELLNKNSEEKYAPAGIVVDGYNKANGEVVFGTLLFTTDQLMDRDYIQGTNEGEKLYQYYALMSEIEPSDNKLTGVTYDDSKYIVILEWMVTDTTVDGVVTTNYGDPYIKGVYEADVDGDAYRIGDAVNGFTKNDTGVTFENRYQAQTGTTVIMTATKVLAGAERELKDNEFSFELIRWYKDDEGVKSTLVETATNKADEDGNSLTDTVTFTRTYPATISSNFFDSNDIATFIYQIKEIPGGIPGMIYSNSDFWVEVKIEHDDATASLKPVSVKYFAECDTDTLTLSSEIAQSKVEFTNTYTVKEASYAPLVNKQLLHWTSQGWQNDLTGYDKAFSFELVEADASGNIVYITDAGQQYAKVIATANNDEAGNVAFASVPYTAAGTHYYMIREAKGSDPNITYNQGNKVVYLKVVVTDNASILSTSVEYGTFNEEMKFVEDTTDEFKLFTNYYGTYNLSVDLNLVKQVNVSSGSTYQLKDNEFDFDVYWFDSDKEGNQGDYVTSGTNRADGKILLGTIQITQAQFDAADVDGNGEAEFKFLVEEQSSGIPGITVDKPMTVTVTVKNEGYGNLRMTGITYEQSGPIAGAANDNVFTNIYTAQPAKLKLTAHKTLIGKVLKDGEFKFILSSVNAEGKETTLNSEITVTDDGVVTLPEITFVAPGTYIYTFKEKTTPDSAQPNYDKYTFDKTVYTIIVNATDDGKGQLHAVTTIYKNYDSTAGATNEPVGGMAFTNIFEPSPIEKDLTLQIGAEKKVVDADGNVLNNKPLGGFKFIVKDANGNPVLAKDGTQIIGISDDSGKITFAPAFNFEAEGEYHYYISEIQDSKPGYVYDENTWALHILVRYNPGPNPVEYTSEGQTAVAKNGVLYIADADVICALKSTQTQQSEENVAAQANDQPVFVNVYKPDDTSIHMKIKKTLEGRDLKNGEFKFHLMRKDEAGKYSIIVSEASNGADGVVNFHITYKLADLVDANGNRVNARTFSYEIYEDVPDGNANGVIFDGSKKYVEITVKDEAGALNAYIGENKITSATIGEEFKNTYRAESVQVPVSATKVLTDGDISTMSFQFELVNSNGEVVQTVNNDSAGLITFQPLTITHADLDGEITKDFVYTIREKAGKLAAVTYDDKVYTVTITVTDNLLGNLQYAVNYNDENGLTVPVFNNIFDSSTNDTFASIQAKKTLTGKNLVADAFTFELVDAAGNIVEAKNDSNGAVTFTVPYTAAGTYTYTLREKAGADEAMEYDTKTCQVEVVVAAGEDGRLGAVVTYKTEDGEIPTFHNIYTPAAAKVTLTGTKTLSGRDMKAGEFKFLVVDSKGKEVATGTNAADGKITFTDIVLTETGNYLYSVTEVNSKDDNITYDSSKFAVGVVVTNVDGVLKAEVTYEKDIKFSNTYTPDPTEPPTEAPTEEPTKPSKPSTNVPDTGDHMRLDIPIVLLVISMVGILIVLLMMKSSTKGKYRR